MDNDSKMLKQLGYSLIDMQVKYRASSLPDKVELQPKLEDAFTQYALYQTALLDEGIMTTQEDLDEMDKIQNEINKAATKQALIVAIGRFTIFVASKII